MDNISQELHSAILRERVANREPGKDLRTYSIAEYGKGPYEFLILYYTQEVVLVGDDTVTLGAIYHHGISMPFGDDGKVVFPPFPYIPDYIQSLIQSKVHLVQSYVRSLPVKGQE